jgi:hypothetical protein
MMPTTLPTRVALIAIALALMVACGSADEPVAPRFDFEQGELLAGWNTTACAASLRITREPENVREGAGALELAWEATEGRLAIVSMSGISLDERPRSLRLSLKLGEGGPVMYGVQEADGSSYQGYLYTPGGVWHDVAVDLDELMLSEGSEDETGRLDVHEINAIMVADLSNIKGEAGDSLGIKQGRQMMYLDNVELSSQLAPHRSSRGPNDGIMIDDFVRRRARETVIHALPIGGPRLSLVDGPGEDDESALRVEYASDGYRWVGFVAAVGYLDLTERSRVCMSLRAEQAAPMQVVLEERDGSKYVARHRLEAERGWYELRLPFDRFKLDPQTRDENETLNLEQLRVIIPVVDTRKAETEDGGVWEVSRIWVE